MSKFGNRLANFAPMLVAGLFIGRLASELWAFWNASTALWIAAIFTVAGILFCTLLLRPYPLPKTWPFLLLLGYTFYPERSAIVAALIITLTFLTWWQIGDKGFQNRRKATSYIAPTIFLASLFLLYLLTLAPDILPADNGEFQLVATTLGVAHPPGFPLYTMLAHLVSRLPLGPSPAYRINLFSALTSTLTLATVYVTVLLLTRRHLAAVGAALALATATTYWAQATTANIRSLTALFAALLFLTLILFYRQVTTNAGLSLRKDKDHYLILSALIMGLGVSHHVSLAFLGLVGLVFVLVVDTALWRSPGRWWRPALAFLLGLLPLIYLPLRANSAVRGASPGLATWSGFLEHVLATGFQGDLFTYVEPRLLAERLSIMFNVYTFQFSPWLLLAMLVGLILLFRRDWRLALLLGGSSLLFTLITATYRAPQTVEYMLPAYVSLALLLGVAAGSGNWMNGRDRYRTTIQALLASLIVVLGLSQFLARYQSYSWLSRDSSVRDYANSVLIDAPPAALLLANWHWVTPLWYLQEVEGQRRDVEVRYVFPEGEPYAETWARRIGEGLAHGRTVIATNFDQQAFADLPTPEPLGKAFLFSDTPRTQLPDGYSQLDTLLGNHVRLLGYRLGEKQAAVAEDLTLTLAWQPVGALQPATNLFAHLVGDEGTLVAQDDVPARARDQGITLTEFRLAPYAGTEPGDYHILVGAYNEAPLAASSGETRIPVTTAVLTPAPFAPATRQKLQRDLLDDQAVRIVGYDWDNTLPDQPRLYLHLRTPGGFVSEIHDRTGPSLPPFAGPWGVASNRWPDLSTPAAGSYIPLGEGIAWTGDTLQGETLLQPGQELTLKQHFLSSRPILRDLTISVRLIGYEDDRFHWAWWDLDDAIPAMGAIPTLKWIAGSEVDSPHFVTVGSDAKPGQDVSGALTLYDAFTGQTLPVLDDRLAAQYGWVPLGKTNVAQ